MYCDDVGHKFSYNNKLRCYIGGKIGIHNIPKLRYVTKWKICSKHARKFLLANYRIS